MAINCSDGDSIYFTSHIRALAQYYERNEALPIECHGGSRKGSCHLGDLDVEKAVRAWLATQTSKDLVLELFHQALNTTILPELGIRLSKPLCHHTACHWLVKLGYQRCLLKKGVYMDGHEHEDVVHYHDEVFLPRMKVLEASMTQYHGPSLEPREPVLKEGEKHIIAQFHDESCFHANEFKHSAW